MISCLPDARRKRKSRKGISRKNKGKIKYAKSIDERPIDADLRKPGHWEIDTAVSRKSSSVLVICVERSSRMVRLRIIQDKSSEEMKNAVIHLLRPYKDFIETLTFDNGTENALHYEIGETLDADTFFCHVYSSWEKGTVENTIGLIRRIFPKGTDWRQVSQEDIKELERQMNCRPRKCLQFKTLYEVFMKQFNM